MDRHAPRPPVAPVRCWLYRNPHLYQKEGLVNPFKIMKSVEGWEHPVLAIDIGADAIWVMDAQSNALIGSAWRTQVTATATTYTPAPFLTYGGFSMWGGNSSWTMRAVSVAPQLAVSGPSWPPFSVASVDMGGNSQMLKGMFSLDSARRFAWRDAAVVRDPADYVVLQTHEWLTLVDTFGLSHQLEDRGGPG